MNANDNDGKEKLQLGPIRLETIERNDHWMRKVAIVIGGHPTPATIVLDDAQWNDLRPWAARPLGYDEALLVDGGRKHRPASGISVRGMNDSGRYENADIAWLELPSLLRWLRSRGGVNRWAERCVCVMLGWTAEDIKALEDPES